MTEIKNELLSMGLIENTDENPVFKIDDDIKISLKETTTNKFTVNEKLIDLSIIDDNFKTTKVMLDKDKIKTAYDGGTLDPAIAAACSQSTTTITKITKSAIK